MAAKTIALNTLSKRALAEAVAEKRDKTNPWSCSRFNPSLMKWSNNSPSATALNFVNLAFLKR